MISPHTVTPLGSFSRKGVQDKNQGTRIFLHDESMSIYDDGDGPMRSLKEVEGEDDERGRKKP